jgi:DNA uptake protein ComE-like DNA-binding protein
MKRSSLLSSLAVAAALTVPFAAMAAQTGTQPATPPASTPAAPAKAPATTTPAKSSSTKQSTSTKSTSSHHMAKVDINSASKDDLMKVKGMTDADADKIVAGRPYKSVSELKSKKIIDAAVYNKVHSHLEAKKAA